MADSDHDFIDYWAVFTDVAGIVHANEYYSEWTARQFKRLMAQKLHSAGIHDAKLWIEHGHYDRMVYPNGRHNMNKWELPPGQDS
jgi:hypothetical protein